ncbi:hypothetical protein [Ramlibacter sp. Leaf400]|uniref:hypothetical protein n=1 Tax=Ramlibacter sp. Leaf400 TaxID=1736365 RepID=UPI0006F4E4E6|nr:hypothetical protein [Ramlibacter sp. Leaf400]KQT09001.1 hypothetical protein ASG30_16120 [Ramlibacter sp. Leaf400]
MSTPVQTPAPRPLFVQVDARGGFHVVPAGEPLPDLAFFDQRERVERQAAQLRGQAVDETAVLVGRWAWGMAALCAAALRQGEEQAQRRSPAVAP